MSSIETKRSRNRGTVKSSQAGQTCNKNGKKTSGRNEKKISKYFIVAKQDKVLDNSDELSDSPYKIFLKETKTEKLDNSASDFEDFKTPRAINKVSKILSKPVETNAKKKKTRQLPLRKFVEDNFKHSDVNPEHLQMALALSESSYEAENPNATPSSQEKKDSFKLAFEIFGFGYSKTRVSVKNRREVTDKKINKKSRYRFVTPILKIRTNEEREALIASKVSLILAQNNRNSIKGNIRKPGELFCETLKVCQRRRIFKLNCMDISKLKDEDAFYVQGLGVEISRAPCGCLLRDWRTIPGRERSPEPNLTPPTLHSPPTYENSDLEHLPCTSNICRKSPTIDLSCSEINELNNSVRTEERLRPKITSPVVERLFENPNDLLFDVNSESAGSLTSGDLIEGDNSCRRVADTPECISIDSDESPRDGQISKYRLSPEITFPILEKVSPVHEASSSQIVHASINLGCGDFTTSFDTSNSLLSSISKMDTSHISGLSKCSSSPAVSSLRLEIFPTNSQQNNATLTPVQRKKRSHDCLSPDLFDSDDEQPPNRLRGGQDPEEIECYDLTQSDNEEEKSLDLKLSDCENSIDRRSDLNVTDYVQDLLSNYKEEAPPTKKMEEISTSEGESQQSQNSVYISDDELNYSSVFGTPHPRKPVKYNLSEDEEFGTSLSERIKSKHKKDFSFKKDNVADLDHEASCSHETSKFPPPENSIDQNHPIRPPLTNLCADDFSPTPNKPFRAITTPTLDDSFNEVLSHISPGDTPSTSNSSFVIKTKNVTPMAKYDEMDTPKIAKELDKYGLKPLKRQKGAKLLKYIYESTHPVISDENHVVKRRRIHCPQYRDIIGDLGEEGAVILERKQSKKFATCPVPLHIVWHNFVMSNPTIRENILLYEPLQLEVLHSMLKDEGFKFNIQDLLAFLDKKCITIRTAQGQHHGKNPR